MFAHLQMYVNRCTCIKLIQFSYIIQVAVLLQEGQTADFSGLLHGNIQSFDPLLDTT